MSKPKIFLGGLKSDRPVYIGIDQSYSGFSITLLDAENKTDYYSIVYKAEGSGVDRLKNIEAFMMEVLVEQKIEDVAMEGYAFGSQMANMLGELGAIVKMILAFTPLLCPLLTSRNTLQVKVMAYQKAKCFYMYFVNGEQI